MKERGWLRCFNRERVRRERLGPRPAMREE